MLNIRRILVPIDFSEYCSTALRYAYELAALHDADVDLVHVIEEPVFPAFYKAGEEAMYGEVTTLEERAREALSDCMTEAIEADLQDGVGFHIERGKAHDKIVEVAEEHDTDLIVISTHGLSGVERVLVGSVAERVIREAPCPVFVIKSYGKSLLADQKQG